MGYNVELLTLDKAIEYSVLIRDKATERLMKEPHDTDLQQYRDYAYSVLKYLEDLKEKQ